MTLAPEAGGPGAPDEREWLEADGLGGFASGTASGIRTRRYHALLLAATKPPGRRLALVNGFEAWLATPQGRFPLTSQRYEPGVIHPDGATRIRSFEAAPWPRWVFEAGGRRLEHEIFARRGSPLVALTWRLAAPEPGVTLELRPLLSGRDYHALHRENPHFDFDAEVGGERVVWRPYPGLPAVLSISNASRYRHEPAWYRRFLYSEERDRGLDCLEDLASPGQYVWDLSRVREDAVWVLATEDASEVVPPASRVVERVADLRAAERRRRSSVPRLERGVETYLVRRDKGRTIVAGYPWFVDSGRHVFASLRGLCLATGRLDEAREVLVDWAGTVVEGLLPNRFPEHGDALDAGSTDASLWYVIAVYELLAAAAEQPLEFPGRERERLREAVDEILRGHVRGTRLGVRADRDGLLAAGVPGHPPTWMEARVDGRPVAARVGKPVELQALWLNALHLAARAGEAHWREPLSRGLAAFRERFWNEEAGFLNDVVDVDHAPGTADATLRPNQALALGGLPRPLLDGPEARRAVDVLESRLLTPLGLRTLPEDDPRFAPRSTGGPGERDAASYQGGAWPWLLGAFVDAWVRVRGGGSDARREARQRFLEPLIRHLDEAGLGHISELADGAPPHTPRGCPFHALSLAEAIRLERGVLAERAERVPGSR